MIYLDHNASTPLLPEARDALLRALAEGFANPSSSHAPGKRARAFVDEARAQVAGLLGCDPDEVLFTSGCTESNNLAIRGTKPAFVVTSDVEHPASARACDAAGVEVVRIGVDERGVLRVDDVERALDGKSGRRGRGLLTFIHAHNETGVVQPVARLAALGHAAGALVHADGAQSAGKLRVDVRALGVDLLSVAGHKLGAPKGVGALYAKRGVPLEPLLHGAGHERGLRPGTENVASIAALGAACAVAARTVDDEAARVRALRDRLEAKLRSAVPGLVVHGEGAERLPNTLFVAFPGVDGRALLDRCPDVAASTGSACHDGDAAVHANVRLSLGRTSTADDVERAAAALVTALTTLQRAGC